MKEMRKLVRAILLKMDRFFFQLVEERHHKLLSIILSSIKFLSFPGELISHCSLES